MDAKKLKEAITHARQAIPWQYRLVCDAAEAHLATIPRIVEITAQMEKGRDGFFILRSVHWGDGTSIDDFPSNIVVHLTGTAVLPAKAS